VCVISQKDCDTGLTFEKKSRDILLVTYDSYLLVKLLVEVRRKIWSVLVYIHRGSTIVAALFIFLKKCRGSADQ
jgi:hypothetical protein